MARAASILAGRNFAAELIEEMEEEADLVHWRCLAGGGGLQHGKSLAVGVQVKVPAADSAVGKLAWRPELGLIGVEGVADTDGLRFLLKSLAQFRIIGQMRRKNLHGDNALQAHVPGAVHLSHTARAERRENFVRAQAGAGRKRHWAGL